jgi:hypothetical protein
VTGATIDRLGVPGDDHSLYSCAPTVKEPPMSQQPQGPGWWQASDGRWYPPQPGPSFTPQQQYPQQQHHPEQQYGPQQYGPQQYPQQQYGQQPPPAPRTRNRGCVIAVVVTVVVLLAGIGVVGYFVYRAVTAVTEVAGGVGSFGEAQCPTEQDVSSIVGSPVNLVVSGNIVVAAGCSYLAVDQNSGADVQITTGAALIADDEFTSFASDAATQGVTPEPISVGDRAEAFGGSGRSEAIAVVDNSLILVEVFSSSGTDIGDKKEAAITLLQQVIAAR